MRIALPFGNTPENKRGPYREALRTHGIEAVEDAPTLDSLHGLVLAGGTDVDPALYHAARDTRTQLPDGARDAVELKLLREALDRDLPVLAICRGMQLLNVACGGTLVQHIDGHKADARDAHTVTIEPGSRLHGILGSREYLVNSRHHQSVERLGEKLVVSARAPAIVEAVEMPANTFVLGVQWHPEDRVDGRDRELFRAFAAALRQS